MPCESELKKYRTLRTVRCQYAIFLNLKSVARQLVEVPNRIPYRYHGTFSKMYQILLPRWFFGN